ncbi:MAG: GGDEF domain-containing protein [Candidatus Latescibacterota bacterium]
MPALSEQELVQICRKYELACPICGSTNRFYRLKPDIVRAGKTEGDGHPLAYRWAKEGFDTIDPKRFFFGVCARCRYTGELDDADFRQASGFAEEFRSRLAPDALRDLLTNSTTGKGAAQGLGKLIRDSDPLGSLLAQFHLGVFSQCLNQRPSHNNLARYYLRIGWIYRDQPLFYPEADVAAVTSGLAGLRKRWERDVPANPEHPAPPGLALGELEALRFCRSYFARNYEMLREARREDELRLRQLLGEVGYRIYELSSDEDDYRKAASFFSGAMQQCLSIIADKSIVGGVVNRARETLDKCGERGRQLRELHKSRGGADSTQEKEATPAPKKKAAPAPPAEPAPVQPSPPVPGDRAGQQQLDQARRQAAVLQEEVTGLRDRVKVLEEDNRRWRQLAAKDPVTGLPNRNVLVRLVMPKVLRSIDKIGPFSCIGISLDKVSEANGRYGWQAGDRMLQESVRAMRQFVGEGEELYRLDGVHFTLVGPMSTNAARQRATDMRRQLSRAHIEMDKVQFPLVASLGVVTVEKVSPNDDGTAANSIVLALLGALYRAKEKGGNTVEVHGETRF